MEFGVWFADELSGILQSLHDTGDDFAAIAEVASNPEVVRAYRAGFQSALRSISRALDIQPPKSRPKPSRSRAARNLGEAVARPLRTLPRPAAKPRRTELRN